MSLVFRLEQRIGRWTRAIAVAGFLGLLVVALATTAYVLLRWIANAPIKGLNDINGLVVAIVIASCLPLVIAERQNISIRFLGNALGVAPSRWLEAFSFRNAALDHLAATIFASVLFVSKATAVVLPLQSKPGIQPRP